MRQLNFPLRWAVIYALLLLAIATGAGLLLALIYVLNWVQQMWGLAAVIAIIVALFAAVLAFSVARHPEMF